jgi:diketogulonate reductase-like aldo/keto reductase
MRHTPDTMRQLCRRHRAGTGTAGLTVNRVPKCLSRGIAFVPFCPLGWPRGQDNPVLTSPAVIGTAARLGMSPAQVALQWLLQLAPDVLLIPGTGSVAQLRENLAAEAVALDDEALSKLDGVAPDSGGALPGRMRRLTASRHAGQTV